VLRTVGHYGAWTVLLVSAIAIALPSLAYWIGTVTSPWPVLFGDGAAAHAGALVARGINPYGPERPGTFVAANYPPLAYLVAAAGEGLGPFVGLRVASLLATLATAGLVALLARSRPLAAAALAVAYLATFPVRSWAAEHRPDDLAVLCAAVMAVVAGPSWRRAIAAGVFGALAIAAKQSAVLPVAAILLYLVLRERETGRRVGIASATTIAVLAVAFGVAFGPANLVDHLIDRNALAFSMADAVALSAVAVISLGAFIVLGLTRGTGRMRAYVAGAVAVALLAGKDGASVNYHLDLAAASTLAIASAPTVLSARVPMLLTFQLLLVVGVATLGPLRPGTGTVGPPDPGAVAILDPAAHHLVEDSGVLVAAGIEPDVDELFIWSRLVELGRRVDDVTPRVERAEFATIVASVPLDQVDAYSIQRERWPPRLVAAVLRRYQLAVGVPGYYEYRPR